MRGWAVRALLDALFLSTILISTTDSQAAEPRDVGEAVVIKNQVTAADSKQDKRQLAKGDVVREEELLETQKLSHGEFRLADDTKLALGPNARLVLDKFVYDPDKSGKQVLINFAVGAFRFISSAKDPTGYELKTPTATLGVRGTVFDFYIGEKGGMAVLMHKGAVEVCSASCRLHNRLGRLVYVTKAGNVVRRKYWDPKLLPGVRIKEAFPFLGKKLAIDDVIRYASLTAPAGKAAPSKTAKAPAVAPTFAFNMDGTFSFGRSVASVGQPGGPVGGGRAGPGNGNGNSPNAGNGGGNLGGSGPGTGNGGSNNGGGNGSGNGGGGGGGGGNGGGGGGGNGGR
ncbi:MAG TPA: FecR domain-containing protein [Hyphomicrobiaceae bacterium]|nr:FecR domain-containing protein [Hyphomicrobiaceae bacterium]